MSYLGTLLDFQLEGAKFLATKKRAICAYDVGLGKAQPLDCKILTPDGWKLMGDIEIGDKVFGSDGYPHQVVGVFPQPKQSIYKITFSDKSSTKCTKEHLWKILLANSKKEKIMPLGDIKEKLFFSNGRKRFFIPITQAIKFPKSSLPVDPYFLGALLGDGAISKGTPCLIQGKQELEVVSNIENALPEGVYIRKYTLPSSVQYSFTTGKSGGNLRVENPLTKHLRDLGLWGTRSGTKFIPEAYKFASIKDRISLLQGLLDTDGCAAKTSIVFSSKSKQLAEDLRFIVQSLGGIATTPKQRVNGNNVIYILIIRLPKEVQAFRVQRKQKTYNHKLVRGIEKIEEVDFAPAKCISIDSKDGTYITDECIVTHNTHVTMAAAEKLFEYRGIKRVLVITPSYLKWKWANELEKWTDTSYAIVDGTPSKRAKIIETFDAGYLVINYELLLQDYKTLLELDFDVVISDEVTRIKSYNSKTKKAIKQFKTEYRWGLTGTPVSNKPDELYSIMDWIDNKLFGKWYDFDKQYIIRNYFGGVDRYVNLQQLAHYTSSRMISMTQEEAGSELPEVIVENLPLSWTPKQLKLYNEIAASLEGYLDVMVSKLLNEDKVTGEEVKVRERFNALRMVCVAPILLRDSKSKYVQENIGDYDDEGAKIETVKQLILEKIKGTEDKMIIFSFYRGVVPIIAEWLDKHKIGYKILMGGMDAEETQAKIVAFGRDDGPQIFLTTEAGDKGIDLQAAKYLVNMDIPFSWEKYEQRIGRMKRVGAKHSTIVVYNLIMHSSFEERQFQIVSRKGELSEAIRGKSEIDTIVPVDQSLRKFLKGE